MSISLFCPHCGDDAGDLDGLVLVASGGHGGAYDGDCPGKGNHRVRTEQYCFFGLLNKVTLTYYSGGNSTWYEYVGRASRFVLWFAICYAHSAGRVWVNDKQACWNIGYGFIGDGIEELMKMKKQAK